MSDITVRQCGTRALVVLSFALVAGLDPALCAPAVQAWVQRYNSPSNRDDYPMAIAVGYSSGNVFVTGLGSGPNYTTIGYSSGGSVLWTNIYTGPARWEEPLAIAVDESDNVYVTGDSFRPDGFLDIATIAYSATGKPLWTNRYGEPFSGFAEANAVAVAATSGVVYVAGDLTYDAYALSRPFVVAYTSKGQALWTNHYNATPSYTDATKAMAVAADGTVYVTGACDAKATSADWFAIAYASNGTGLWTNRYNGPGNGSDCARAITVAGGKVYVTGYSEGIGTRADYTTIVYSASGQGLWTNRYDGPSHQDDWGEAVAADRDGNVFTGGLSGLGDMVLAYGGDGTLLWTQGPLNMVIGGLAVDSRGDLVVAGRTTAFDPRGDFLTVTYSTTGLALWTNRFDSEIHRGDEADGPYCLGLGAGGAVYVTGASEGAHDGSTNVDFLTIKYVPAPDIWLSAIDRLSNSACRFTVNAPVNMAYGLEASPDLTDWQTLTNFPPLPVPSVNYTDTLAPAFGQRYYRAVWSP